MNNEYETPVERDIKLRHWSSLCVTDPAHTKPFQRPGGFRGTAIRPIWNQYRLTTHFGPAGVGWGTDKPDFQVIETAGEILVFCTLRCWYMDEDGKRAELYGVGGDKVTVKRQSGSVVDDEAFKKAFTDALGNAFVRVGLSADVHMGMFEDSKYVEWARANYMDGVVRDESPQGDKLTRLREAVEEAKEPLRFRSVELAHESAKEKTDAVVRIESEMEQDSGFEAEPLNPEYIDQFWIGDDYIIDVPVNGRKRDWDAYAPLLKERIATAPDRVSLYKFMEENRANIDAFKKSALTLAAEVGSAYDARLRAFAPNP